MGSAVYERTRKYTNASYRYYPSLYSKQKGAGINTSSITQPTIDETIPDPYNESSNGYNAVTIKSYSQASTSVTVTQTWYNSTMNETNYGEVASVLNNGSNWIASRFQQP